MTQPKPLPCPWCDTTPKEWVHVKRLAGTVECQTKGCPALYNRVTIAVWNRRTTTQANDDEVRAEAFIRAATMIGSDGAQSKEIAYAIRVLVGEAAAIRAGQREPQPTPPKSEKPCCDPDTCLYPNPCPGCDGKPRAKGKEKTGG